MSPLERDALMRLEPELRQPSPGVQLARRELSPGLVRIMFLMRLYVLCAVIAVGVALVRGVH